MSAPGFAAHARKPPRYYVLEVTRTVQNRDGDAEPETWVVVGGSFPVFEAAWRAASIMREMYPLRVFIGGELIPQYQPR